MTLAVGLKHAKTIVVDRRITVPAFSDVLPELSDMPAVLATASMVIFVETTCLEAIRPHLDPGQHSVGTHVDISHLAATPPGMQVTAHVELVGIEGRKLRFRVSCHDEKELIGEGFHERTIIDVERFSARVQRKRC